MSEQKLEESSESENEAKVSISDMSLTETEIDDEIDEKEVQEADKLLEDESQMNQVLQQKKAVALKEQKQKKDLRRLKSMSSVTKIEEDSYISDLVPWFKMRECLLLTLQARITLKHMILIKLKEERTRLGDLSVSEIQNLLRSQKEDQETDWITEIQELKRNLVSEIRRNHLLERELAKLDKRIALLIKNRGNIQEEISTTKGHKSAKVVHEKSEISARKLEHYQNLFYLLQTEPKYLAQLVYLMVPEQMEAFLDTVILTLYGDAFSPREEFLILRLFQLAIEKEMSVIKNVSDFLKADSVVPKMVITYNKRKQGSEFLQAVLGPMIKDMLQKGNVNLELKPQMIYQGMINEKEIATGEKSNLDRNLNEEQIMELPEVQAIVKERISQLEQICQTFFNGIINSLNKVPYGIRWICKQIRSIAQKNFSKSADDDILKVTGYFVYYRFINLAIVTPDSFEIINTMDLTPIARKNLVAVAKVLQNLFNFSTFTKTDKWMMPLNAWIKQNLESVRDYFTDLIEVADPEDYLQVDKYMELTQRTKPVIIISLHEISLTHNILRQHLERLTKEKDDPLRLILNDLGESPNITDTDDREIQLTLTNRFKQNMEEEISASASLYAETKELVINTFRLIPVQNNEQEQTLLGILKVGQSYAKEKNNSQLSGQIDKILENIKSLENEGLISKSDNYASFLRDIALEVANRNEIRDQQRKEIKRLTKTLTNLRKHQKYLNEQIQQYNEYLQDCRLKHYQSKIKKKKKKKKNQDTPTKIGPFKFSYNALVKAGVIIDSEIPSASRKKIYFYISSEAVGVFDIVAKLSGVPVEKMTLELDDLLERNYNNITRLELEQVVLDVNMMIHLINKFFLK